MRGINRRGQEGGISMFTVGVIVSLLVLVVAIVFLAQPKIVEWIKNLPGHDAPADNSIELSADEMKTLNYNVVGHINVPIDIPQFGGKERYVDLIFKNDIKDKLQTPIYLAHEKVENDLLYGDLYLSVNWAFDLKIGTIEADRVSITISQQDYDAYLNKHSGVGIPAFALVKEEIDSS